MNIISSGIQFLLEQVYGVVGDYGIAIIIITLIIKTLLIPLGIKQRKSMEKQQEVSEHLNQVKEKYKGNEAKIKEETDKVMMTAGKSSLGCLLLFLQLPIMWSLYKVISNGLDNVGGTVLVPWIQSLTVHDPYFIIPIISVVIQLLPQAFPYVPYFKNLKLSKMNTGMFLFTVIMNGFFVSTIPAGVGVYWIVSGVYSLVEQLVVNLVKVNKLKNREAILVS